MPQCISPCASDRLLSSVQFAWYHIFIGTNLLPLLNLAVVLCILHSDINILL